MSKSDDLMDAHRVAYRVPPGVEGFQFLQWLVMKKISRNTGNPGYKQVLDLAKEGMYQMGYGKQWGDTQGPRIVEQYPHLWVEWRMIR